jgi:hypothetical protein
MKMKRQSQRENTAWRNNENGAQWRRLMSAGGENGGSAAIMMAKLGGGEMSNIS